MPADICIINYGLGNICSVRNAFDFLGASVSYAATAVEMANASAYVLPGVGAFGEAMASLKRLDLIAPLREQVLERKRPLLGICLGMQLLAEESIEKGHYYGLGWLAARVTRFPYEPGLLVPHVGWNKLDAGNTGGLFNNIDSDSYFYFDHSYYLDCAPELKTSICRHGVDFTASVQRGNIFATQFHPELSHRAGLKMLRNFLDYCLAASGEEKGVACR